MDRKGYMPCSTGEELVGIAALLGTSYFGGHMVDYAPLHCIALQSDAMIASHRTRAMQSARLDAIVL